MCEQPKIESIHTRMTERGVKLQELKEQMNGVEDEVFRKFCREIGVANIRSVHIPLTYHESLRDICQRLSLCYVCVCQCIVEKCTRCFNTHGCVWLKVVG